MKFKQTVRMSFVLSYLCAGARVSIAQDVPLPNESIENGSEAELAPARSFEPPPLINEKEALGENWGWVEFGPKWADRMADVAVHPSDARTVVAVALDGEVFVTRNGGRDWTSVLPGMSSSSEKLGTSSTQEDILLNVEARIEEVIGDIDDPMNIEFSESADEITIDEIESVVLEATDDVRAETEASPWFIEHEKVMSEAVSAARPRVWFGQDGLVFVGRADGLYRSDDAKNWDRVLDVAVTALAYLEQRNLWVAGSKDGIRFSVGELAGQAWIDAEDDTESLTIFDLASSKAGMYAATNRGLWFASDAQTWTQVAHPNLTILSVLPDPNWEGGMWVTTPDNVFRSDDGGVTLRSTLGAPIHGVVSQLYMGPGHVLIAGSDGPWETLDGGTTWTPVSRGLSDPGCRRVDWNKGLIILASNEGVFRLEPILSSESDKPEDEGSFLLNRLVEDWIPIQSLVDAALRRPGLSDSGGDGRTMATILPTLTIEGRYQPRSGGDNYNAGLNSAGSMEPGTTRDREGSFFAMARLQWTPVGRKQAGSQDMDGSADTNNIWVMVDGTEVVVGDGSSPWVMAQSVSRNVVTYRNRLASDVTDLYFARADLIRARPLLATDSVLEQVELELKLDELEARLDFLTDGAVARWYTSQHR